MKIGPNKKVYSNSIFLGHPIVHCVLKRIKSKRAKAKKRDKSPFVAVLVIFWKLSILESITDLDKLLGAI